MRSSTYFEVDGFGWRLRYGRDCNLNDFAFDDPRRVTVTGGADSDGDELHINLLTQIHRPPHVISDFYKTVFCQSEMARWLSTAEW